MIEDSISKVINLFLSNGVLGAIIVLLLLACWRLFNLYIQVQEQRIATMKESIGSLTPMTEAIKQVTEAHRQLATSVDKLEERIERNQQRA